MAGNGYQLGSQNKIFPMLQGNMSKGLINLSGAINDDGRLKAVLVDGNYNPTYGDNTFMRGFSTALGEYTGSVSASWIATNSDVFVTGGVFSDMCGGQHKIYKWWPYGPYWTSFCTASNGKYQADVGDQWISSSDGQTAFPSVTHGSNLEYCIFYLDSGSTGIGTDYMVGIFQRDQFNQPIDITTDGGDITFEWKGQYGLFQWRDY